MRDIRIERYRRPHRWAGVIDTAIVIGLMLVIGLASHWICAP